MIPPAGNHRSVIRALLLTFVMLVLTNNSPAERLPVKIYTSADGLGSSYVNYLMRDSRGFLWICTRDGLSRFDGSHFVTYQVGDKSGSPGIEQILETRKGIYWIVTTSGLYRFDPNEPLTSVDSGGGEQPILRAQFAGDTRASLYEDHEGTIWLSGHTLSRLIENDGKPTFESTELVLPDKTPPAFNIGRILEAKDRSLWMITTLGIIRRLPDGREIIYRTSQGPANSMRSILEDDQGRIWVGAAKSVFVISPDQVEGIPASRLTVRDLDRLARQISLTERPLLLPEHHNEILSLTDPKGTSIGFGNSLYRTSDNHIWISNTRVVSEFDGEAVKVYSSAQGFVDGIVQFAEDVSGNLWLGGANGLMRLDRGGLTSYATSDGLSNPNVLVINKTRDDKLYVMTRDLSLSQFDGKTFQTVRPALPASADIIWTGNPGFQDSKGEWWFLTIGNLYRFPATNDLQKLSREQPRAIYANAAGLPGNHMFHLWEDSHNDLWVSTRKAEPGEFGLSRWNRASESFSLQTVAEGFPARKEASSFVEDRRGNLWFGLIEGGLVRLNSGRFTEFTVADGAPGGFITSLYLDQQQRLWIGSSENGLSRIDDTSAVKPQFVRLTAENGLASKNVRSIIGDAFGNIYVGTARGVDRISPDGVHLRHYSISDGLAGDFVAVSFCDSAGVLWFGTPNGLSRLEPRSVKPSDTPPVWISGLRIAGEERRVSDLGNTDIPLANIGPSQNNLQIDFFGIAFDGGESLRYQYKLEGADQNWSAPTQQRSVNFANLQPGAYRFLVRAINSAGLPSSQPATVSFRILAPVWLRWWFVTISVLLVGLVLIMLYKYRVARLREVNAALMEAKLAEEKLRKANEERLTELERVRKRIATDLHDDIGSSLTRISLLSEVAQRRGVEGAAQIEGALSVVAGLSRELVDSMSDIVWAINPERDSLGDLTQRMRRFAGDVFSARGIDFQFLLPDSERDIKLGANVRRELFLIFKEGVNNAVRHAGCTLARIELRMDKRSLVLKLSDNGRGFDALAQSDGHGLASMRARSEGLGGTLEIVAAPGSGTVLTLSLPWGHHDEAGRN